MINQLNSIAAFETVLMRLSIRHKQFIYQIARLDYRIFKKLVMLETVNNLILNEEQNVKSLNAAIIAAGKGKISDKLTIWKVKAEYKLFKLHIRKSKIDVVKLIINQSKLEQLKQALASLEEDILSIESQKQSILPLVNEAENEIKVENMFTFWEKARHLKEQNPVNKSIKTYLKEVYPMAS